MPALTTQQSADFDRTYYPATAFVYIVAPELVFEAPLAGVFYSNDAIVALDYGTPTTGAFSDVKDGYTLEIWNGTRNAFGSQRVRGDATADAITVGRSPEGTRPGELSFEDGATVRVYKERRVWAKNPFIDSAGTQYKDELAYPGDNAAQPPVANAGLDRLILSTSGGETITLDALGDIPSFAVRNGATLTGYTWVLDGGIVDTGTLTDSSLTATFGYGVHDVSLTVTDSNGITHTCYKLIVVARPSECVPVQITRETISPQGVQLQLSVDVHDLPATARPNSKVLYMQYDTHGAYGNGTLAFSGWLAPEQWSLDDAQRQRSTVTIECHDVGTRLRGLFGFPLTVSNESTFTGWYRMPNATIDRLTHHYLQWHTNALDVTDFTWSGQGGTYPLPRLTTSGLTIFQQGDRLAQAIAYRLTCKRNGALQVKGDPLELPTSEQAAEFGLPTQRTSTVITTISPADYGRWNISANQPTQNYWLRGSAVVASSIVGNIGAVKCSAPGKTPAQGVSSQEVTDLLVVSQEELNVRMGNRYAAQVNPEFSGLTLSMVKTAPLLEPADMEWVTVVLPEDARSRYPFWSVSGNRCLVDEITNTYNHRKLRRSTSWQLSPEIIGRPAQTIVDPPPQAEQYPSWVENYVPIQIDTNFGDASDGLVQGVGNLAMILSDGTIAVTTDFSTPSWEGGPSWVVYDHTVTLGASVLDYSFRATATNISGWLLTPTQLWYGTNLQSASPTFTLQHTFGYSSNFRTIDSDYLFAPGLFAVVVSSRSGTGCVEMHTLDGGSTWSSEQVLDTDTMSRPPMVRVSNAVGGKVFACVGQDNIGAGTGQYLQQSTNYGDSYINNTNIFDDDSECAGFINVPFDETFIFRGYREENDISPIDPALAEINILYRSSLTNLNNVDISPIVDSVSYGPTPSTNKRTIGIADNDANKVVVVGSDFNESKHGVFVTPNALAATPTWVNIVPPEVGIPYRRCALANNGSELYVFGETGNIAYSDNPYQRGFINNRIGNLSTVADVIGIAGF